MKLYDINKHLTTDDNGNCIFSEVPVNIELECLTNNEIDYRKYAPEELRLCYDHVLLRSYIIPEDMLGNYFQGGEFIAQIPKELLTEKWYECYGRKKSKKNKKKKKKNRASLDDIFIDDSNLERVDVKFIPSDKDTEFVKELKIALNKKGLKVEKNKAGWFKAACRKLKSGDLSMKEMEKLIRLLNMNYSIKFYSEV